MLPPQRALLSVSLLPLPPAPMAATLILLFRFWPLRIKGPNAVAPNAAEECEMNLRRDSSFDGVFVILSVFLDK
jgi:hypothetical protein